MSVIQDKKAQVRNSSLSVEDGVPAGYIWLQEASCTYQAAYERSTGSCDKTVSLVSGLFVHSGFCAVIV